MLPASRPALVSAIFPAALLALALAACTVNNPNFCDAGESCNAIDARADGAVSTCNTSGPDPRCPADEPVCTNDVCGGACTADTECASRTDGATVCLMPPGDCVACDENDAQAAPGSAEDECPTAALAVCDGDSHTCRACEAHTECASGVCDAGTCVEAANVIYMKADGTDTGDCLTQSAACLTMHYAKGELTPTRKYIVMAPSATPYNTRSGNNHVEFNGVAESAHIVGTDANLRRTGGDGYILEVKSGARVTIDGLTISNASGSSGTGVKCNGGSGTELELRKTRIRANEFLGVDASECTLRVFQSTISNNQAGGIMLTSGRFQIVNNFIFGNGGNVSTFGGVSLTSVLTTNAFEFNTVVANNSNAMAFPDGVTCNNAGLAARNNIITGALGKSRVNASSACNFVYTVFAPDGGVTADGNLTVNDVSMLMFTSNTDLHIGTGSVAVGRAQSSGLAGETLIDADGQARVAGGTTVDVGADEIP